MKTLLRLISITLAAAILLFYVVETHALPYPIVGTGQTACFSDTNGIDCPSDGQRFFGQDFQYEGAQPYYTDNGDGTITDNVTGLMWQKDPGEKMTFVEAKAGAARFSLSGYTDWRLPTIKELYSLIMFNGTDPMITTDGSGMDLQPFIDTDYFVFQYGDPAKGERNIDSQFVSSTTYVGSEPGLQLVFGVNFADGRIKGYGASGMPGRGEKMFYVLYVRGNKDYGINDFENNADGTVTDYATGLTWQQKDSGKAMNWEESLSYCENLELAGRDDWRLPNAKELQSILDYTRSPASSNSAAIDPVFKATPIINEEGEKDYPFYWSSTTHISQGAIGANAAYLSFGRGLGYMHNQWIDIHGAGSQRSDPKAGDPSQFPLGMGPQGDARRVYNYARCVTGGVAFNDAKGAGASMPQGIGNSGGSGMGQGGRGGMGPGGGSNSGGSQGMQGGQGGRPGGPPQEAFDACEDAGQGDSCSFESPHGEISGSCTQPPGMEEMLCIPAGGPMGRQ